MQFNRSLSPSQALAILLLLTVVPVCSTRAVAATPRATWQRHVDALAQHPDLVRLYTFDDPATASNSVPNTAGEDAPLTYAGREPLVTVASDVADKRCPRLDSGWFQAKPFIVGDQGFTVEMRFRKLGQGSQLGNGRSSGMLLAVDNGYWSGFRIHTSYPERNVRFEIGRPKPSNAFGLATETPVPDGGWCHVAATWDRRQMRLYVNGLLAAVTDYDGPYTPGTGMLKIGYADSGIGSLRMDVDEVVVFRSALRPAEVLRHAYYSLPLPGSVAAVWDEATTAIVRHDWPAAQLAVMPLRQDATLAAEYRTVAGMVCAESLRQQGGLSKAIAAYSAIFETPETPPQLRELAAGMCLPPDRRLPFAAASRGVYERLLEQETLAPADRTAVRLCLADRCLDQGDTAAARRQYDLVLGDVVDDSALGPQQRWNVGLRRAHTWVEAGDYAAARKAYMALSTDRTVEMAWRSVAALCFAETFVREKDFASAEETLLKFAAHTGVTPYFREEAEQRIAEIRRLQRNQPACDPAASRTQIPPLPKPAIQFHVSVDGNDKNPGTAARPFATLPRARDAIRAVKAAGTLPRGGIAVLVHGGQYPVQQTLELQPVDSGTVDSPIVYQAAPGEQPTFSGGVRLSEFAPVREQAVLDRLPAAARAAVRQCDLKRAGVTDFGRLDVRGYGMSRYPTNPWVDLYVDRQAMELARWPNEGRVHVGQVLQGAWKTDQSGRPGIFEYDDGRPASWQQPEKAWMFGAWAHLWAGRYVRLAELDTEHRRITTAQPSSYGFRQGQPYYYLNILEELDRPGQWYLDRTTGILYLYPIAPLDQSLVQFPILEQPFLRLDGVQHVTLRGLTFELGRAEGAVISDGERVLLAGCTFRQLGTNGVIIQGGRGHGLLGCDLAALGGGGVRVAGGDRASLTGSEHFVENCHIRDFSRVDRVYAPAVHADGVGIRIAHNLIHDSPHHAMRVEGYEHTIEFNEVHDVVYEFDDQAGIDIYGNPAYRGIVIRHNFWHHIDSGHNVAGQAGIRLDDFISSVRIYGNVFYRCAGGRFGGVQIHGGKDNIVDNNLFVECKYAVSFSPWGEQRWRDRLQDARTQAVIRSGGVDISKPPHSQRYPDLATMDENPDRNFLWRNVAIDCGQFATRDRGVNQWIDNRCLAGDSGFADAAEQDFTLSEDSSVYDRSSFRPIPFREIGLYQDEYRASWPVVDDGEDG